MMRISLLYLVLFSVVVVILSGCSNNASDNNALVKTGITGFSIGDTAPDFSIKDVDGTSYSLSQLKGKPVIIAYFASWCAPCQIEANNVKQVDDESGGRVFEVFQIGVDNRESLADLKQFKDEFGNTDWIVGFGFDIANQYNVRALDTTVIVDKEGVIVYRDNGIPANIEVLNKWLT